MRDHFAMFAAYNQWANVRLYDAAVDLGEDDLWRDSGVFFSSLGGTLNHLLVADRIWLARFTGADQPVLALSDILHRDLAALREARVIEDARIRDWIDGLEEPALAGDFTYVTVTDRKTIRQRLAPALAHFFNHQTHHRGQAHAVLTRLGRAAPPLDLIYFQRTEEGRRFG